MIIVIDSSSAQKKQRTGVEEYAWQLIEDFRERVLVEKGIDLKFYDLENLRWPFKRGWMQLRVTWELWRRPPQVFFVPAQGLPFFISQKIKVATTIHDVGFRRRPDLYRPSEVRRQNFTTRRAVRRADIIFTPSEFTKKELVELFRAQPEKIIVTPLAADKIFVQAEKNEVEKILEKYRLGYKNYFLFVSRWDIKKNLSVLISAFAELKSRLGYGDPTSLVFVGIPGFGYLDLKKQSEQSSAKEFIHWLENPPRADLPALMVGSTALLAPGWHEGFGLTPLEAAACGTPVVASDIPAHREVMEDAALFVPPGDSAAWVNALEKVIRDPVLVAELSKKGLEKAKQFSWSATAETTWEELKKIYGTPFS